MKKKTFLIFHIIKNLYSTINHKSETLPVTFIRHGQSTWNQQNIFIGMTDTPLTTDGINEARIAGQLLGTDERTKTIDVIYTSLLRRSIKTVWYAMEELGMEWVPVIKDWRLNERSYGSLVGRNKKQCVEQYGKDLVKKWRRSWDFPPPPMTRDSEYWPGKDPRYHALGVDLNKIPLSESLKDVTKRTSEFWDEVIIPKLKEQKRILIVGHENNLRSIIKRLDNISDEDILHIELPRAIPLVYELDPQTLKPVPQLNSAIGLNGRYLVDKKQLERIAEKDQQQVYDLRLKTTLETTPYLQFPQGLDLPNSKSSVNITSNIISNPSIDNISRHSNS
mmetsp:Transcript_8141/g.7284  ORF Transcript_8141/g.7284 Transcript_8141/m.7284 type:complete len:335 (+) Transcript_8141:112-1116(+)